MALNNRGILVAVLLVATAAELVGNAAAATYVVGDNLGWRVPNSPSDYSDWASQHVFRVGDVIVFNFVTGQHDVAQVSKAAFDGCSSTTPILLQMTAPWNTTLNSTGEYYYICTFGAHCPLGQKLAINVTAASSASPTPAPAPSPIVPTPAPTPSASPSPAPGSPTPSPSPSPAPTPGSPGSAPASSPGSGATPPPSPPPGAPSDSLTPPPPPSSATTSTIGAPMIGFALAVIGLMI